jgi:hypothetical protein
LRELFLLLFAINKDIRVPSRMVSKKGTARRGHLKKKEKAN